LELTCGIGVPLWNEIFKKFGKNPPLENFWIQLKNITGIEPIEAQKLQGIIRKWYLDDISLIILDPLGHPVMDQENNVVVENDVQQKSPQDLSFGKPKGNTMSQQLVSPQPDQEKLEFGKAVIFLPKNELKKEWEKLQKYMKIYLEDYEESNIGDKQLESDTERV
jgi:hypothetical protein